MRFPAGFPAFSTTTARRMPRSDEDAHPRVTTAASVERTTHADGMASVSSLRTLTTFPTGSTGKDVLRDICA